MYYRNESRMDPHREPQVRPTRSSVACRAVSRWVTVFVATVSAFAIAGCYTVRAIPLRQIDDYPSRETASQVTVAAEPFRDKACAKVFNHRLNRKGFLPVLIVGMVRRATCGRQGYQSQ